MSRPTPGPTSSLRVPAVRDGVGAAGLPAQQHRRDPGGDPQGGAAVADVLGVALPPSSSGRSGAASRRLRKRVSSRLPTSPITSSRSRPTRPFRWRHRQKRTRNARDGAAAVVGRGGGRHSPGHWEIRFRSVGPDQPAIRSIAILPLQNLTGDPEQAYFVDGLHEELIATFAQISAFDKVIARTSVLAFRDSGTPVREIGRQLGVDLVVEGSVRRSGNTVRTTVQLIDARPRTTCGQQLRARPHRYPGAAE